MDSKLLIGGILVVGIIFILVFALKSDNVSLDQITKSLFEINVKLSTVKCITPEVKVSFAQVAKAHNDGQALIDDPKNFIKPSSVLAFKHAYTLVFTTIEYILDTYKVCTDQPCSGHGTVDPTTNKCVCNIGYDGDQCQNIPPCHGIGKLLDNGNCNYVCGAVFPRCTECTGNINQSDINNVKCTSTISPSYQSDTGLNLFDPDACVSILDKPLDGVYGCPIKPDATAWTQYLGSACNIAVTSPGGDSPDRSVCAAPAVTCQTTSVINGNPTTGDYCHAGDFTKLPEFTSNFDARGLAADKSVSGLAGWLSPDGQSYNIFYPGPETTPFNAGKYPVIAGVNPATNQAVCTSTWTGTSVQSTTNYWDNNPSCIVPP